MTQNARRTSVFLSGYYGCGNLGDDPSADGRSGRTAHDPARCSVSVARPWRGSAETRPRRRPYRHRHDSRRPNPFATLPAHQFHLAHRGPAPPVPLADLWRRHRLSRQPRARFYGAAVAALPSRYLLGVRVAALGVGVGDLRTATGRWLLRGIVARCELFLVRDDAALRQCAGTKARLTDDLVFAWQSLTPEGARKRLVGNPASIGLTVSPLASERTLTALADAVRLWQEHGHRVVFIVFQQSATIADDAKVFAAINNKLPSATVAIEIRRPAANASAIIEAFADIDIVCGMRFHGLVLAAMLERPFVGIVHDNKISEICRRFDMPCHEAATFDGADLARSAEDIYRKAPDSQVLDQSRRLAKENFLAFGSLLS